MKTTFGFCVCCAAAGVPATVTAATEANEASQVRLVMLIAVFPVRHQKQVTAEVRAMRFFGPLRYVVRFSELVSI